MLFYSNIAHLGRESHLLGRCERVQSSNNRAFQGVYITEIWDRDPGGVKVPMQDMRWRSALGYFVTITIESDLLSTGGFPKKGIYYLVS